MKFRSFFSLFGKGWRKKRSKDNRSSSRRVNPLRLALEALEDRTLMSVLPAAVVGNQQALMSGTGTQNASGPQAAVDPLDPNRLVVVASNELNGYIGRFSTDGGFSWS